MQRVQLVSFCESLDGGDFAAVVNHCESETRVDAPAIDEDRAGATLAVIATWLQSRKTRKRNTDEHLLNASVLHEIREDVRQTNGLLVTHISDREAHALRIVAIVDPDKVVGIEE